MDNQLAHEAFALIKAGKFKSEATCALNTSKGTNWLSVTHGLLAVRHASQRQTFFYRAGRPPWRLGHKVCAKP